MKLDLKNTDAGEVHLIIQKDCEVKKYSPPNIPGCGPVFSELEAITVKTNCY